MNATISDQQLLEAFPDTLIDHDNKEFYRGWLQRRLLLNRCADCGHWHHPPRPMCPECWSRRVQPMDVSGTGRIHLLIKLHLGPPAPDVDYLHPHPVATVELSEQPGLRYTSTIVNCPLDEIRIGLAVRLTWIDRWGAPYPVFEPATEAD
jgi:uncharacterized OB-fold protein